MRIGDHAISTRVRHVSRVLAVCAAGAVLTIVRPMGAQARTPTADTVLFAGDLNGDARSDSLVIEARPGNYAGLRPYRAALHLGGHTTRAWSSGWDDEDGRDIRLLDIVRVNRGSTLLAVESPQADFTGIWLLRVAGDSVVKIGEHGIDYGEGDFALESAAGGVVLRAAPVAHLQLRRVQRLPHARCARHDWPGVEARFDAAKGTFAEPRGICMTAAKQRR